jgi:hypothetical protein
VDTHADVTVRAVATRPLEAEAAPGWTAEAASAARRAWRLPAVEAGEPVEDAQVYAAASSCGWATRRGDHRQRRRRRRPAGGLEIWAPVRLERRSGDRAR